MGTHSITAGYGGDSNNAASTSTALNQVINGTFTFTSDGSTHTVLAGQSTPTTSPAAYTFVATPTSAGTFGATVTFACSFAPTDPTLTNSSCTFNTGQANPAQIAAGSGPTQVSLVITTKGPNRGIGNVRNIRRRADNRSPWLPLTLPLAGIVMAGFAGRKVWKHSAVASLCVSLMLLGLLVACGGSTAAPILVGVGSEPALNANGVSGSGWPSQTASFTATVTGTSNTAVAWTLSSPTTSCPKPFTALSACGSLSSTSANPTTYTAPTIAAGLPTTVTITATSQADTTKSGSAPETITPTTVPGTYTVTVTAFEANTVVSATPNVTLVVN